MVEAGFLLSVGEDVVSVLDLFELGFGRLVARVGVGMMLAGEPTIRLLDLIRRGVALDAEDFVKITIRHARSPLAAPVAQQVTVWATLTAISQCIRSRLRDSRKPAIDSG